MLRYLRLLWLFTRVSIQDAAAYRADFVSHLGMALLHLGAELIGLWAIFSNARSLMGWSMFEMLALLGVFRIMAGVIGLGIAPNMRLIMQDIRDGRLDFVLIKPVSSQFYASFRRIMIWRLTDIIMGLGMAGVACVKMSADVSVGMVLAFLLMLACGVTIIYSFWLTLATLAFWFTRISNIEMVFWNVFEAGRYPVDVYPRWVRRGLTYVIPLAFLTTFPASTLVGKTAWTEVIVAMVLAAASLLVATLFWRFGLRHYSGASA